MKSKKRIAPGYGNAPISGGVDVPIVPPHPLDRACCRKWWKVHRHLTVVLKIAHVFGFGGNPRLLLLFTRGMDQGALHLGAQKRCLCRDADVDAAPHPEALRELMALAASNPVPVGVDPWNYLDRLAREVAARRGIAIPGEDLK